MNLNSKLSNWEQARLITPAQSAAIKDFEWHNKSSWLQYSLLFISALCIGTGILSVIASNWDALSANLKLLLYFIIASASASSVYYCHRQHKPNWFEAAILAFAFIILSGIGLISQIYQLQADGMEALLLWSILCLPLLFFSRKPFFHGIWLFLFLIAGYDYLLSIATIKQTLYSFNLYLPGLIPWILLLSIAFICSKLTPQSPFCQGLRFWLVYSFALLVLISEAQDEDIFTGYTSMPAFSISFAWLYWVGAIVLLFCAKIFSLAKIWVWQFGILLAFNLICYAFGNNEILSACNTIAVLLALNTYAYRHHRIKLLNLSSVLIALRFFIIYLQVFDSLLSTGIGLIISGLVFIGISVAWHHIHKHLSHKLQEA